MTNDAGHPGGSDTWPGPADAGTRSAIVALHRIDRRWNLIAVLFGALWVGAGWLMVEVPVWPVRVACTVVIGAVVHALAILMHEAIHGNFFRRARLDRWAGFLLGAPSLFSATAYKVTHALHHRYNRTRRDPDEFTNLTSRRGLLSVAFYAWGAVGLAAYLVHVPFTALLRGNRRQRQAVLVEYGLLLAAYAGVLGAAHAWGLLDLVVRVWILPMAVAAVLGNVRGWAEHTMTRPGNPLTQTRTVTSNALVSFFMCNLNYHLEHHLYPGVPWYHLPAVHRLLRDEFARNGAIVYGSYVRFVWDALRTGVHGIASVPPQPARPII